MKKYVLVPFCLILGFSCKKEPPVEPPSEPTITVKAEDASCTEAWLKVTTTETPATVRLLRDNQRISNLRLLTSDSLLVNEGLLPNRTYSYQLHKLAADSTVVETSASVQVTTMDTTSHNFTWQIDTLGDGNSSVLYDVAIVNDTLAYAVGEMYKRDSLGNWDPNAYNLVKWDGNTWELMRVPFIGSCSAVLYPPLKAIWAISPNEILVSNGGAIATYNGTTTSLDCRMNSLLTGAINKLYATSMQDIYAVGNSGAIVHYSNGTWRRLESGTTVPLNDVWGGSNRWVGDNVVLATGSDDFTLSERKIIRINANGAADSLTWGTIYRTPYSIWFDRRKVFVCGSTFWKMRHDGGWQELIAPSFFMNRVRGTATNDLIMVGHFGIVMHFNGLSVHGYDETRLSTGYYASVALTTHTMIAVGRSGTRAIVVRGWR